MMLTGSVKDKIMEKVIFNEFVEQVLASSDIVAVVSEFVILAFSTFFTFLLLFSVVYPLLIL